MATIEFVKQPLQKGALAWYTINFLLKCSKHIYLRNNWAHKFTLVCNLKVKAQSSQFVNVYYIS